MTVDTIIYDVLTSFSFIVLLFSTFLSSSSRPICSFCYLDLGEIEGGTRRSQGGGRGRGQFRERKELSCTLYGWNFLGKMNISLSGRLLLHSEIPVLLMICAKLNRATNHRMLLSRSPLLVCVSIRR